MPFQKPAQGSARESAKALKDAYAVLQPYSTKYIVDMERYEFTLKLIQNIPDLVSKKILDVGTGIGIIPIALRKLGLHASGLEHYIFPSHGNDMFGLKHLEAVQSAWKQGDIIVYDTDIYADDVVKVAGKYDVVVSEATIEHVKDPQKFLERCGSLLNPGGYLIVSTPNVSTLLKRLRFIFGKSPYWPIEGFFKDGESFTGHWREYTLKELEYMCTAAGFQIVESHNVNALTKFKSLKDLRKNLRATVACLSWFIPGSREMNYVVGRK